MQLSNYCKNNFNFFFIILKNIFLNLYKIFYRIRRDNIFEDGYECFKEISTMNLKARLVVFYINELGMEE